MSMKSVKGGLEAGEEVKSVMDESGEQTEEDKMVANNALNGLSSDGEANPGEGNGGLVNPIGNDFNLIGGNERLLGGFLSGINAVNDTGTIASIKDTVAAFKDGLNEIRDTFYVTPPDNDWKQQAKLREDNAKRSEDKRKERVQNVENRFVKNEGNKQYMFDNMKINGMSVMDYYKSMYPGKSDTYVNEQATNRVEQELEKMKGYAAYGMSAQQAYPLYLDQKKYGFTPEEAIRNNAKFESFDANIDNVNFVNDKYESQGIRAERVSDVAPNAKEYYSSGHKDIRDILNLNYIQQKLQVSVEKAMQIDSVLSKHGRLECSAQKSNESAEDYKLRKEMYDKINEMYRRNQN